LPTPDNRHRSRITAKLFLALRPNETRQAAFTHVEARQIVCSPEKQNEKQTAKLAIIILSGVDFRFKAPTKEERGALLVGFAMRRKVLSGCSL
jgi:hypothetical protein